MSRTLRANATDARIYSGYSLIRVIRDEVFPSKPEEPKNSNRMFPRPAASTAVFKILDFSVDIFFRTGGVRPSK
jgi:hypothetical protein